MRTAASAYTTGNSTQLFNLGPFRKGGTVDNVGFSLQGDGFLSVYTGTLTMSIANEQSDTFDGSEILLPAMSIALVGDSLFRLIWLYRMIDQKRWVQVKFDSVPTDGECLVAAFAAFRPMRQQEKPQ